jgi:hypothetical protein
MRPDELERRLRQRLNALAPLPAPSCSTYLMLPNLLKRRAPSSEEALRHFGVALCAPQNAQCLEPPGAIARTAPAMSASFHAHRLTFFISPPLEGLKGAC